VARASGIEEAQATARHWTGRAAAELRWSGRRCAQAYRRRCVVPRAVTPTRTPDRFAGYRVERDLAVPMRDGVALRTHVFHPAGAAGPLPVVLIRQPYGRDDHPSMHARGAYWARKGYRCVVQDVRGKYGSGGRWEPLVHEAADGWDTLDWVAAQPWCNGNVGMAGESYHGITQWAVAGSGHPNLRCVAPGDTAPDFYRAAYRGGAFSLLGIGEWAYEMNAAALLNPFRFDPWHLPLETIDEAAGAYSPVYKDLVHHPRRDAWWRERDLSLQPIAVPGLHWSGWYDVFLDASLAAWCAAGERHTTAAAIQQLVLGPTDHGLTTLVTGHVGRIPVDCDAWCYDREERFFERWLRGVHNGVEDDPAVQVYVVGADRWHTSDTWPLPEAEPLRLYLHGNGQAGVAGGGLSAEMPGDEPGDVIVYDPDHPVDYWLTRSIWDAAAGLDDRRPLETRPDVLVFTTAPLDKPLEVVGPLSCELYVSSSAPDTDFTVALADVFPDGHAQLVQEGIVRVGALEEPEVACCDGDEVLRLTVDMAATGHLFGRRHRLRLEVSSSNFGRYDRNLNTGHPPGSDALRVVARQTVRHDRRHASHLTLPVIPVEARVDGPTTGKRH
jgi:hypothetical protein